jgi:transcriptional regulator with XRE-family HTH domain
VKAIELLAYNVAKLQEHEGLAPAELAARANVPVDYIQRLLQGQEDCTVELLERLADILEYSVRTFFVYPRCLP